MSKRVRARRRALAEAIKKPIATGNLSWDEFVELAKLLPELEVGGMVTIQYLDGLVTVYAKNEFVVDHFRHSLTEGMLDFYGWGAKIELAPNLPVGC